MFKLLSRVNLLPFLEMLHSGETDVYFYLCTGTSQFIVTQGMFNKSEQLAKNYKPPGFHIYLLLQVYKNSAKGCLHL